jgi:uncharacterized protein
VAEQLGGVKRPWAVADESGAFTWNPLGLKASGLRRPQSKMPETCLYRGEVVHRRLNPLRHELRYRVFNLFADVDRLEETASRLRLFSYNRFNLFGINDRNHGPGDGTPVRDHAWKLARSADGGDAVTRIFMFCYPSVLGYVFNPLTVYYGFDAQDRLRLMIYEVNNTFGGRHSYVVPVGETFAQIRAQALLRLALQRG